MLRLLMLLIALLAIGAVLWASWRLDRRLFAGVLIITLLGVSFLITGIWKSAEESRVNIAADKLLISVNDARGMEEGVRLRGHIENRSPHAHSHLYGVARLLACEQHDEIRECQTVAEAPFSLRMHVPAGGSYPWSSIIRMPRDRLAQGNEWQIHVDEAIGFPGDQGTSE